MLAAMILARVSIRQRTQATPQTEELRPNRRQAQSIIFLDDTLHIEVPKALLARLGKVDAEHYNRLRKGYLRTNYRPLVAHLDRYCEARRACDWCRYMLVEAVSEQLIDDTLGDRRIALQIFLLERMGFDARAAIHGSRLAMLLPFDAKIYERPYIEIGNQRFYIFEYSSSSDDYHPIPIADNHSRRPLSVEIGIGFDSPHIATIELPLWSDYLGEPISAPISPARIELMRSYPTTEKGPFHRAEIPTALDTTLLPPLAQRIAEMSQTAAANFLLGLVQHGFGFTSDSDLFGRHKQMTIEESLFYGRNNCKDRTLIYAWLVDRLLGLPTVLIDYQIDARHENIGHVACGVAFDEPIEGRYIIFGGERFTICDPSYLNAPIGCDMPRYADCPIVASQF